MVTRKGSHYGDETCSAYVRAGDCIYLAHHAGGFEKDDIVHQMEASFRALQATLEDAGASLDDMVQIHLYLRNIADFGKARDVFYRFFESGRFPARMGTTTDFVNPNCLCMLDGVAYKKASET